MGQVEQRRGLNTVFGCDIFQKSQNYYPSVIFGTALICLIKILARKCRLNEEITLYLGCCKLEN